MRLHYDGWKYFCPVTGCGKKWKSRDTLKKHYSLDGPHKVEQMLDRGLPVWFYRQSDKHEVEDTLEWLKDRGYVQHEDPKRRTTVEAAYEEESGDDDIF